jgi:hypothetical protein
MGPWTIGVTVYCPCCDGHHTYRYKDGTMV